jgi:hypothetical protein
VFAVQVGIDVLHDVDVLPARALQAHLDGQQRATTNLLSRISLISFTSVFMFVVGEICTAGSELPRVTADAQQRTFIFFTATVQVLRTTLRPRSSSSASALPDRARLGSYTARYTVPLAP